MRNRKLSRLFALLAALSLLAAACGDGGDDEATDASEEAATDESTESEDEAEDDATAEDEAEDDAAMEEGDEAAAGGTDLSGVCPSPLVIQTDWFAEAEHGALYELISDDYTVDADNLVVSGPGQIGGEPLGIDIEVRSGGPAIGFAQPRVQMYTDDSIHLGYSNTDGQAINFADLPLISVVAPLEINPQMVMWDPEEHPEVETIADLGEQGITINLFSADGFPTAFVAQGIWTEDQLDPSYDGGPARFVADPTIAQQGFASAEPFNYENVFEDYGRPVKFQLLHDAGWEIYSQTLAVKPDDLEELRPCLEQFVPVVQQAAVDAATAPDRSNAIIVDAVEQFDSFWVYSDELAAWSVEQQIELGLVGNGPDDTVGNMDEARIQKVIEDLRGSGVDVPEDLTATDMFTNEFIDPSIGF